MAGGVGRHGGGAFALTGDPAASRLQRPEGARYASRVGASLDLNRLDAVAAVAAIVTTGLCIEGTLNAAEAYLGSRRIPQALQLLPILGWLVATFAPLGLAVGFWRLSRRVSRPWLLHLQFLPCAFVLFIAGARIMGFVANDPDFDATLGGPVIQAFLLFVISTAVYFGAVVHSAWRRRAGPAGSSPIAPSKEMK